jgi:Ser/Thr protein kinase RdoA (MazF antagonist)
MNQPDWIALLKSHYDIVVAPNGIRPFGDGHIHRTFLVQAGRDSFILQAFNKNVFRFPERISHNHGILLKGIDPKDLPFSLPLPIPTHSGQLFAESDGHIFRLSPFVAGKCVNEINNPREAFLAAEAFAIFIRAAKDLNPDHFQDSIPRFHDLSLRFGQLQQALKDTKRKFDDELQDVVDFYLQQESLVQEYEHWKEILPLRITHNDTKINNLIYSDDMSEVRAVIDLDTIMAGYAMYDFGDLVRTVACTEGESSKDWEKIKVDWEKYQALLDGFLAGGKGLLTEAEIESLPFGGKMMTCIMGFRFLADYLNGNIYYAIHYERQNLDRAINQMWLLRGLGERRSQIE